MEQVHNSVIRLAYLKTEDHTADIPTKPLPPSSHWHHMGPLLGENPAIAAIMEDVAHIKGRAVCLHVDVRRMVKRLTFHADVSGGGETGAPGGKARELAGEQRAVEQAQAQRRKEESIRAEAVGQKRQQLETGESGIASSGEPLRVSPESPETRSEQQERETKKRRRGKKEVSRIRCHRDHCRQFQREGKCSRENCPFTHQHGGGV